MKKGVRMGSIDFLRFLLSIAVLLFHGRNIIETKEAIFTRGYFAVEFFFIISGYFLAMSALRSKRPAADYMKRKYKSLFDYHAIFFVIAFVCMCVLKSLSASEVFQSAIRSIPELLLLPVASGFSFELICINNVSWYIAYLLVGSMLLYPIVRKSEEYAGYWSVAVFIFGIGTLYVTNGRFTGINDILFLSVRTGLVRSICSLSAGVFVYYLCDKAKNTQWSTLRKVLMTVAEIGCWGLVFFYMNSDWDVEMEFALIFIGVVACYLSFTQKTYTAALLNNGVSAWLGKFSYPIYLCQAQWIRKVVGRIAEGIPEITYGKTLLIYICSLTALALCVMLVKEFADKVIAKSKEKATAN